MNTPTRGWLTEIVDSDSMKITGDGKYEYQINLINLFQKNSQARLYVKNINTNEEKNIPIDIAIKKISLLSIGDVNNWVKFERIEGSDLYLLNTTEEIRIEEERFVVDIETGASEKLNNE